MITLLIDIGNTKAKFFIKSKQIFLECFTKELNSPLFLKEFVEKNFKFIDLNIDEAYCASVVPSLNSILEKSFNPYLKNKIVFLNYKHLKNLSNSEIGADLIAQIAFGMQQKANCFLISFGTAITIAYIKSKQLVGINILPGLTTSLNTLQENTALLKELRFVKIPKQKYFGQTSNEAVTIGLCKLYATMLKQFFKSYDKSAKIITTGGDYKHVDEFLEAEFHPHLVIEGLEIIFNKAASKCIN